MIIIKINPQITKITLFFAADYLPCNDEGTVKLTSVINATYSRLELCHDGRYGTVCGDNVDNVTANIVCQELGFAASGNSLLIPRKSQDTYLFPVGSVSVIDSFKLNLSLPTIILSGIMCNGSEERLIDCVHDDFGSDVCNHSQDLAIKCHGIIK